MSVVQRDRPSNRTVRRSGPLALGRQASFWVSAGVVVHTFWSSAAPAMTYQLYADEWRLTHTVTTGIFAIYPIVVVAVLILFGDISDHIGRRTTMLLGLCASLIGALLFAVAPDVLWLFAGRAFMGVGVGLTAGPSTAAMVEFSAEGQAKRAASVTAAAQAFGFTGALLLGGALTQYAPWPTHLSFWVLFALIGLLFAATWFLPRHVGGHASRRWRPKVPSLPPGLRPAFALASIAVTTAYTHGVLILSLGGQVARDLVGSPNAFVNGAALSLFAITSGVLGIVARDLRPRPAMMLGAIASAVGMGLLALSVAWHGLWIFLAATAMSGVGYSLLFLGGLTLINGAVATERRGGVLSAVYLFAYLSLGIVAVVLGAIATQRGLGLAVDLGAGIITLLSLVTIGLIVRMSANAPATSSTVPQPLSAASSAADSDLSA
ncbi:MULTISPECIES: MFS transporter [Mesorhizobium]|uniref:MFS transporter n=1 Tax=Mesorhizobium TaxID=68287 RepID=UPI0010A97171|nr:MULTISPECIES: MFS transporter [Mesorhizobium]